MPSAYFVCSSAQLHSMRAATTCWGSSAPREAIATARVSRSCDRSTSMLGIRRCTRILGISASKLETLTRQQNFFARLLRSTRSTTRRSADGKTLRHAFDDHAGVVVGLERLG